MSGTRAGGLKAAQTNRALHGEDFYHRIGKKGGMIPGRPSGFGSEKVGRDGLTGIERSKIAGAKGGRKSRRGADKRVEALWRENRKNIAAWQEAGWSIPEIAKELGLSITTVRTRIIKDKQEKEKTNGEDKRVHMGNRSLLGRIRNRVAHRAHK